MRKLLILAAAFMAAFGANLEPEYHLRNPVAVQIKTGPVQAELIVEGPDQALTFEDEDKANYVWTLAEKTKATEPPAKARAGGAGKQESNLAAWRLTLKATLPTTPFKIYGRLKVISAATTIDLPYVLIDAEPSGALITWTVLNDGLIGSGECLQLGGTTASLPVSGIKLAAGNVKETRSGETIVLKAGNFTSERTQGNPAERYAIPQRSTRLFRVCAGRWPIGEFSAKLNLTSLQEAAPQAITISFRTRSTENGQQAGAKAGFRTDNPVVVVAQVTEPAATDAKIFYGDIAVTGPDSDAVFRDLGEPAAAGSQPFSATYEKDGNTRTWKVALKFTRIDAAAVQRRTLTITANKTVENLEYWIANSAVTPSLTVKNTTDQATIAAHSCLNFTVASGGFPLTGVRLESGSVEESKMGLSVFPNEIALKTADGNEVASIDLPPRTVKEIQLCPKSEDGWPAGALSGKFQFASAQKYFDQDVAISFNTRNNEGWGWILLIVGTAACLFLRFWGDARVARANALVPVVVLRSQLDELRSRLDQVPADPKILVQIRRVMNDQETALDQGHIAPHLPSAVPWGITGMNDLQAYLKTVSDRLAVLSILIAGALTILNRAGRAPRPTQDGVTQAFNALDALVSPGAPALDALGTAIQKIMNDLEASVPRVEGVGPAEGATVAPVTFRTLDLQVRKWVFARLLTGALLIVLAGGVALILAQKSFGTRLDLSLCLLWGFGLSTVAGAITRDQVLSSVGLQVPTR